MTALHPAARELVESDAIAHVVTLKPDGSAHVSAAWIGIEEDEVVFATLFDQHKLQNIRRDPRVVISLTGTQVRPPGLKEFLVLYGTARITEGGGPEMLSLLAKTYLGPDVKFPPMDEPPPGFVTRVKIDRVAGVGPWNA